MVSKSVISAFVLALAAVANAQTYPAANQVPDTKSAEVQAWLKEIDLTGAPQIALRTGAPPACPATPVPGECIWTCDSCPADDIVDCGRPNTWGVTFDDGPSTATPTLLDYLKTQKISASFFLIGGNVVQFPETVKREVAEGHHLASHTWSHHALTTLTNEQIVAEMKWTEKAVFDQTGLKMKYMRPPYGDINNRVRFVLKKLGYIPVDWTGDAFDTNDWKLAQGMKESDAIATFTKSLDAYVAGNKTKGFYCLEHDQTPGTVAYAQKIIPLGQARQIQFASVAQCENDAQPYQAGSAPVVPTTPSGTAGTPSASSSPVPSKSSSSSTGSVTPVVKGTSAASSVKTTGFLTLGAAALVGAFLA